MTTNNLIEKLIESIIRASGTVTTIAVLLIIYFLFTEGAGIFGSPPIEEGYVAIVHPDNPIETITIQKIRAIYNDKTLKHWKEITNLNESIIALDIDNIDKVMPDTLLNNEAIPLFDKLTLFVKNNRGIIAILPEKYAPGKTIEVKPLQLKDVLWGTHWYPTSLPAPLFGALPIILATLLVTLVSVAIAVPLGLMVAVFIAEIASPSIRSILKPLVELLAGVPSVVYGFFGLVVVVPALQELFQLPSGATALAGALMLAIISLPTIITLSEDAIQSVPEHLKHASLATGASHLQTILNVSLPVAISGISSAAILGIGRSIGETMAVLMVTGNSAQMPGSVLDSVRTITATIALELGEAPKGGSHYQSLFILGCILFIMTFVINLLAAIIAERNATSTK